ncbi:MAG: hypothetical protein R3D05_23080 [Dongiaceae bacterium]
MIRTLQCVSIFAALLLAACATTPAANQPTEPITLSPGTQGELSAYLGKVKSTRPGAFAVSPDGRNSFYTWCNNFTCETRNYSQPALRQCQALAGTPCIVLYVRHEPRLAFTRAATANGGPEGRHGSEEQQPIFFDIHGGRD